MAGWLACDILPLTAKMAGTTLLKIKPGVVYSVGYIKIVALHDDPRGRHVDFYQPRWIVVKLFTLAIKYVIVLLTCS
jgi:hypothetical protein